MCSFIRSKIVFEKQICDKVLENKNKIQKDSENILTKQQ